MKAQRRRRGNAITETGPALYIFFIVIFFPMLDVLGIALQYGCGWYVNHLCTRELAVRRQAEENTVKTEVNTDFTGQGMAKFLNLTPAKITHTVTYNAPGAGQPQTVTCDTTVQATPFISVPWPYAVPGLNADMPLTFHSERPREETR